MEHRCNSPFFSSAVHDVLISHVKTLCWHTGRVFCDVFLGVVFQVIASAHVHVALMSLRPICFDPLLLGFDLIFEARIKGLFCVTRVRAGGWVIKHTVS